MEEIFELNDLTPEDVLLYLIQEGVVTKLPNPEPVDL